VAVTWGIDVAVRAAHQATLSRDGKTVWRGRKFLTRPDELERAWADAGVEDPAELTVVLEPTRNAWIVIAEWFRRRGAKVVMVPTTQSADLRKYYSKHAKNDRIDSELLARLPLLHPDGLREYSGQGPADPLRRLVKQRSTMVKRRTAVYARLDALIELLGPAWYAVLGSNYGNAALELLARYADPHAVIRLGQARLARFLAARSRGNWRDDHAVGLIAAARETLALWNVKGTDGMDFAELSADIAHEAEQALFLTRQIKEIDERIANLYADADPQGIVASAPGVGPTISAVIAGRLGDPHRFNLARRDPRLHRPGPQSQPIRGGQDRIVDHQGRRPAATRNALRCGRSRAQSRSPVRCEVPAPDGRKSPPRLRDLPFGHHACHAHRHLHAHRTALPTT
jgi:transposase